MSDTMTKSKRSHTMSRIHSEDTSIELALRKALWHKGYRYRKNYKMLPGKPDIAITKYRIAIFCDSEFFHGYDWITKKDKIQHNREYWIKKIERNTKRDRENDLKLLAMNWIPLHFWGHDIQRDLEGCVNDIETVIFELKTQDNQMLYYSLIKTFNDPRTTCDTADGFTSQAADGIT